MENYQLILNLRLLVTVTISQAHTQKAENTASSEPTKQNHYTRAAKPPVKQQITLLSFSQIHSCLQQEK